jgi:hypothetical protein
MDYGRTERDRLRSEYCKAWRAFQSDTVSSRRARPKGNDPRAGVFSRLPEEAAVLVAALKRVFTEGVQLRAASH